MYSVTRTKATKRETPIIVKGVRYDWSYDTVEIAQSKTAKRGWEIATAEYITNLYQNTDNVHYSWDVRKIR